MSLKHLSFYHRGFRGWVKALRGAAAALGATSLWDVRAEMLHRSGINRDKGAFSVLSGFRFIAIWRSFHEPLNHCARRDADTATETVALPGSKDWAGGQQNPERSGRYSPDMSGEACATWFMSRSRFLPMEGAIVIGAGSLARQRCCATKTKRARLPALLLAMGLNVARFAFPA